MLSDSTLPHFLTSLLPYPPYFLTSCIYRHTTSFTIPATCRAIAGAQVSPGESMPTR